jgi:predicted MPP superfamily phosphohydrolase
MRPFTVASTAAYLGILGLAARRKNRQMTAFAGIVLGLHTFSSVHWAPLLASYGAVPRALVWYAQGATYTYFALFPKLRSPGTPYRVAVSLPASVFSAATFLSLPWASIAALGLRPWAPWLPLAVAGYGFLQSVRTRRETRRIVLDRADAGSLRRYERPLRTLIRALRDEARPLRIVQITDPHLGPFMSEARLRAICERAVADNPDLVLLTGDYLTLESQTTADALARALSPLKALTGRSFACFGNHDHESPGIIREALARAQITLLVDAAAEVDTPSGPVQIVGADHRWREREEALRALADAHPRKTGALRIWLLHDPGAFALIPEGEADLVLSGHTHGGHVGLLSMGLVHTIVSAMTKMPDHGLWARGRDRLYVHRGTGHYGFPLRVGVPAEESLLEVHLGAS